MDDGPQCRAQKTKWKIWIPTFIHNLGKKLYSSTLLFGFIKRWCKNQVKCPFNVLQIHNSCNQIHNQHFNLAQKFNSPSFVPLPPFTNKLNSLKIQIANSNFNLKQNCLSHWYVHITHFNGKMYFMFSSGCLCSLR